MLSRYIAGFFVRGEACNIPGKMPSVTTMTIPSREKLRDSIANQRGELASSGRELKVYRMPEKPCDTKPWLTSDLICCQMLIDGLFWLTISPIKSYLSKGKVGDCRRKGRNR